MKSYGPSDFNDEAPMKSYEPSDFNDEAPMKSYGSSDFNDEAPMESYGPSDFDDEAPMKSDEPEEQSVHSFLPSWRRAELRDQPDEASERTCSISGRRRGRSRVRICQRMSKST